MSSITNPPIVVRFEMFTREFLGVLQDDYQSAEDLFWPVEYSADKQTYDLRMQTYMYGYLEGLCCGLDYDDAQALKESCRVFANNVMQAYDKSAEVLSGNDNTQPE